MDQQERPHTEADEAAQPADSTANHENKNALEKAQEDAAEERENERGYQ